MPDVEVVHDDTLSRIVYEAIAATRAPSAHVDWEYLNGSEQGFYREAAGRMQAAGALNLLPMADGGAYDEDPETAGLHVIDIARAIQVNAVSVAMHVYPTGEAALIGHFGGTPRDDPDGHRGVAWITSAEATMGLFRQIIEAWAALDLETAGVLVKATVTAMERAINSRGLVISTHPERN